MKFSGIALTLSVVLAGPALAAPGDPRLIQGAREWPPALSGGEPFIVVRGDDGRVYHADVIAAQRYVEGALGRRRPHCAPRPGEYQASRDHRGRAGER